MKSGIFAAGILLLAPQLFAQSVDQGPDAVAPMVKTVREKNEADRSAATTPAAESTTPCAKTKGKVGCDSYYPDPKHTIGHPDPKITQADIHDTVCKDHYTESVRDVTDEEKAAEFTTYGIKPTDSPFGYEIDHFVSLELGGTNDADNLWPEPYCQPGTGGKTCFGAREKDVVETSLAHRVCAGKVTLAEAQQIIETDWYKEYLSIKGKE
jgi:hypothetical protein